MLSYFIEHNRFMNIIGIVVVLAVAWLFSRKRAHIDYRLVATGLGLQALIGLVVLKTSYGMYFLQRTANLITQVYQFADSGASFLFGSLTDVHAATGPIFAFTVLPVIVFFGALMSLLFHWGVVQWTVGLVNKVVQPLMRTSGAESLVAIANSFLGQTEAPLLIRPYLSSLTKSEMLSVMVCGMGTISGAVLVIYAAMGVPAVHLLAASVMAIPSCLIITKILYPETEKPKTSAGAAVEFEVKSKNMFDAIATGTMDGLHLALAVGAFLISFIALAACANYALAGMSYAINAMLYWLHMDLYLPTITLGTIFGYVCAPFAYLLGFTGEDALNVGQLIGTKISLNEMIAYGDMVRAALPERVVILSTYALCGFANFSSIGIQIGGIGALVPEKRQWLTELGLYAVLGGTLANLLSALIAGLLL